MRTANVWKYAWSVLAVTGVAAAATLTEADKNEGFGSTRANPRGCDRGDQRPLGSTVEI